MLVVLTAAAVVVVAAVVVTATGRGGELVFFPSVGPSLELPGDRPLDAADVFGIRLPRRVWGYRTDDVDEILQWVAYSMAERDARVAILEQRLADIYTHAQERANAVRKEVRKARDARETWAEETW